MTLPLETSAVEDEYARRALDRVGQQFPLAPSSANFQQFPQVSAYHDANQAATTGVVLVLALNSERWDLGTSTGQHDTSTNNSRLTCRVPGLYDIVGTIEWAGNATGWRQVSIVLNGTTTLAATRTPSFGAADTVPQVVARQYRLAIGDYVELWAFQNSGGNLNVNTSAIYSPEFMMHWAGP